MKILVMTKNWIGDILFEFPAIEAIKEHYPESRIACIAPKRCREILENHPDIDEVIEFDERAEHRSLWKRLQFIFRLRKGKWDQVFLFHRSRTRAFMMLLAGVKERIGFKGKRQLFLSRSSEEPEPAYHQVDHFLKLLNGVGIASSNQPCYRFYFKPEAEQNVQRLIRKYGLSHFVCFHLGANWLPKRWPPVYFAKLADLLYQRWGLTVVITGAKRDRPLAEEVLKNVQHARVVSLAGQTGIGELGALFRQSLFLVSGDSGPLHIASGVGARTISIFGPTNPVQTGPRGTGEKIIVQYIPPGYEAPWYGTTLPKEGWLSQIKPEDVFSALEKKNWNQPAESTPVDPQAWVYRVEPHSGQESSPEVSGTKKFHLLFVTLTNIGDVILTTPVLMNLVMRYPNAKITVVAGPKAKSLLSNSTFFHRLVIYDKKAGWPAKWRFLKELRREKYDMVLDLRNSAIPFLVSTKRRSPLFRRYQTRSYRDKHLEVLKMMGLPVEDVPAFDFFHPPDEQSALGKLRGKGILADRDWIIVSPVAGSGLKTWKLDGYREVLRRLLAERPEDILLVGDQKEKQFTSQLVELNPARVHDLAGEISLRELSALISRCLLLLTNDSAVMHLGYELRRAVVAVFGPTHHEKYGQTGPVFRIVREEMPCSPCERPVCRFARQHCFEDLKPEKVYRACEELLRESVSSAS